VAGGTPEELRRLADRQTLEEAFVALVGEPTAEEAA
jgi:hypothetical protein